MSVCQGCRDYAVQFLSDALRSPTNIFHPDGTPSHSVFTLSILVLSITGSIFLIVGGCCSTRSCAIAIAGRMPPA